MRHFGFRTLLVAALVFSCVGAAAATPAPPPTPFEQVDAGPIFRTRTSANSFPTVDEPDPVVQWMVDQVEQETVRQYAGDLSGAWPANIRGSAYTIKTRNTYASSGLPIQQATFYVGDHLRALGLAVEEHRWGPETAPNVIGEKIGVARPGDIFMITAHLDDMPTGTLAPGADDNASGSTAVLIAADVLAQFGWNCTLRFALWTGEEQGLRGSDKYAARSKDSGENIVGVLNLDMIGWNTPGSAPDIDLYADPALPATVDLANQTASVVATYGLDLVPEVRADGTGGSDHDSFWKYSYTAILGIEDSYPGDPDFDPYYHTTGDTLSTLDLAYFTEYVKAGVAETAHMADCLITGTIQGAVTASHNGAGIAGAELSVEDAAGRVYRLAAATNGQYGADVPPGNYTAAATAYGYASSTVDGVQVATNGLSTQDFLLVALPPVAAAATAALDAGEVRLTWPHVNPDTGYQVHRSASPYFLPDAMTEVARVDAAHPPALNEILTHRDEGSGAGDVEINGYYLLIATNAAGAGAASNRTGEFDFALVAPRP